MHRPSTGEEAIPAAIADSASHNGVRRGVARGGHQVVPWVPVKPVEVVPGEAAW